MYSGRVVVIALVVTVLGCAVRPPALDVNNASTGALAGVPGLDEVDAGRIVAGRPYWKKHELVERRVLTTQQYERVEDRLYVGSPAMPEYFRSVPPVTW
jgi:DNA uptake protein ComE-like DNA-binding protein